MPVRRPSVAVSKVDDVPNGEIRDLATPDAGDKDDEDSRINSPAYMTDHCYARPVDEKSKQFENQFANDHGYSRCQGFFKKKKIIGCNVISANLICLHDVVVFYLFPNSALISATEQMALLGFF